jgi:ABC-type multidrug transport system permease subunit
LQHNPRSELLLLYVGLGIIYVFLLVFLGVKTIRNGHWILFIIGFVVPLVWIVGAMIPPKGMSRMDEMYARRDESR